MKNAQCIVWMCLLWAAGPALAAPDAPPEAGQQPDPNAPLTAATLEQGAPAPPKQLVVRPLPASERQLVKADDSATGGLVGSGLVALSLVLLLIGVCAWAFRRFCVRAPAPGKAAIQILDRKYLAPKQCLAAVRLGRQIILVGTTPDRVSHIATIDDPAEVAELAGSAEASRIGGPVFDKALQKQAAMFRASPDAEASLTSEADYQEVHQTRAELRDLLGRMKHMTAAAENH